MGHQLLPGLFLLDIGVTVVSFYRMLFPVFADHLYGLGASGTGMLSAANSIGAILGSSFVFVTDRFARKGLLVLVATLVYAFLLFAFGLNKIFVLGLVIVASLGAMDSIGQTMRQAVAQLTTPDKAPGQGEQRSLVLRDGGKQPGPDRGRRAGGCHRGRSHDGARRRYIGCGGASHLVAGAWNTALQVRRERSF